jgi:hypothetical protein
MPCRKGAELAEGVLDPWQFQQQEWHSTGANQREGEAEFQVQLPGRWSTLGACPGKLMERKVRKRSVGEQVTMYQRVGSAEIIRGLPLILDLTMKRIPP